jgi:adenine-specific DNA glycosylase
MWELPQTPLEPRDDLDFPRELEERYGLRVVLGPLVVRARHSITHRRITLEGYRARLESPLPTDPERFRWVTPDEVAALAVSSMTKKLLRGLDSPQLPLGV